MIKIPTSWVKCDPCDAAAARIAMVRIERGSNDPGGSLLEAVETSIRSGNLILAIADIEKFTLVAQPLTPAHVALLQGACECLRQKNCRRSLIGKYVIGLIPRAVEWAISYLLRNPGNPLNYLDIFPEYATQRNLRR